MIRYDVGRIEFGPPQPSADVTEALKRLAEETRRDRLAREEKEKPAA